MTERIAARIEIGGPLPAEQMVELIEAIEIEKSCSVSSARSACWAAIRNAIRAAADRGEPLIVQESDVAHGIFQTLEEMRSEEHTSELQSLMRISYAVFCLKKKSYKTTISKTYKDYY